MDYLPPQLFDGRVYKEPMTWAINKRHGAMAKVVYEPAHPNPDRIFV